MGKEIVTNEDALSLQQDLKEVYGWAERNNMTFNNTKFELLRYGRNEELKESTSYHTLTGEDIVSKPHVRDLGIAMSDDATFKLHISNTASSAKKLAGWILRTFQTRDARSMLLLWKALVLPRLEYCCQLWSPSKAGEIQTLEALQRSFTSLITDISTWITGH